MTSSALVTVGELFEAISGKPKYTRAYVDAHPGEFPVYSASLARPFGLVDTFDFTGPHLTWVMNGYGGRMQEVDGHFSANRDRGVLRPRESASDFDLTYVRHAVESQMAAAAVGRRVDGHLNEYTKIYPEAATEVTFEVPVMANGTYDTERMKEIGDRLRRVQLAQDLVRQSETPLRRAKFPFACPEPNLTLSLSEQQWFTLSIGKRVLRTEHVQAGVPVYSANAIVPFGSIMSSNLSDFSRPSLLWGIDGVFDWNLVAEGVEFATTDHCGRLLLNDDELDATYVWCWLRATSAAHGFDRVFRASLANMKAEVTVVVPTDDQGHPSMTRQKELAALFLAREQTQRRAIAALEDVLKARPAISI